MDSSFINNKINLPSRHLRSEKEYIQGILTGDRLIISECITLLESTQKEKRNLGISILSKCPTPQHKSRRIGITGTPGVGKSTFIERLGLSFIDLKQKVAVLAIDPSSTVSKGSILGDKSRMESLSNNPSAYIRPTPSSNVLGGIAAHTKETISICELAGFETIIVETVGVGQSEAEVDNLVDINILLLQPGAGDDMQGIKRGILEKADVVIVHKADGVQLELARQTKQAYFQTLNMFHHEVAQWQRPIILASSVENIGFEEILGAINQFLAISIKSGYRDLKRSQQEKQYILSIAEQTSLEIIKELTPYQQLVKESATTDENLYMRVLNLQNNLFKLIKNLEE